MSTTTPEQTHESCVPTWYGQHLERATVLNTAHIATVTAALTGIQAVVDLLHDREAQRCAGKATHSPAKNMGLLAAVHSLATLVRMHTTETAEGLAKRAQEHEHHLTQHHQNTQENQPQSHAQQAQAAINPVAKSGRKGGDHGV